METPRLQRVTDACGSIVGFVFTESARLSKGTSHPRAHHGPANIPRLPLTPNGHGPVVASGHPTNIAVAGGWCFGQRCPPID
jgi:hypothetical protein